MNNQTNQPFSTSEIREFQALYADLSKACKTQADFFLLQANLIPLEEMFIEALKLRYSLR